MPQEDDAPRSRLLDNWRGWAIIFVLLGHFASLPGANFGRVGVELFFVLSGRLMADLLFLKRVALPVFFLRRFSRVLPVSLLFVLCAWLLFPGVRHLDLPGALAAGAMVVNYTQLVGIGGSIVDHYWSLCVEEHSYIALALIALLARRLHLADRRAALVCFGMAALMVVNGWRLWHGHPDYYAVYWRSDVRAATIFMSAGLRVLHVSGAAPGWLRKSWVPLVAFAAAMVLNWNHIPDPLKYSVGSLLFAITINSLDHAHERVRALLDSRAVAWVGLVSYSLYIWQQAFFISVPEHSRLAMLAGALVAGTVSFYVWETPVRKRLNALPWLRTRPVRAT